jgi:hypothetical protein
MTTQPPLSRYFIYKRNEAFLYVGTDASGNIFSKITKHGETVAQDMFVRFPSEANLYKQGWIRVPKHEHPPRV